MSLVKKLLITRPRQRRRARAMCDSVIAAARREEFYLSGGIVDDFDGRFSMVAVHGGVLMRRLKALGPEGLAASEAMSEALFDRFDYAFREEGVGDSSIARKIRKLGEEYFGLARALDAALDGAEPVIDVLARNDIASANRGLIADYITELDRVLANTSLEACLAAAINWPELRTA